MIGVAGGAGAFHDVARIAAVLAHFLGLFQKTGTLDSGERLLAPFFVTETALSRVTA
jgi:hypothetical protein